MNTNNNYISCASTKLIINMEPKVVVKDFIKIGGIGLDATFHFSKIPKDQHEVFLRALQHLYNTY